MQGAVRGHVRGRHGGGGLSHISGVSGRVRHGVHSPVAGDGAPWVLVHIHGHGVTSVAVSMHHRVTCNATYNALVA